MKYCGTLDVVRVLGGTRRFSVGTHGTNMTDNPIIEDMIAKASAVIDYELSPIYGTQGFGTSASGTRGLPDIIKSITEDFAGYYLVSAMGVPVKTDLGNYGKELKEILPGI